MQFQLEDQKRVREFRVDAEEGAEAPTIGSLATNGGLLAVGTLDGRVSLFEVESGELLRSFSAKP